MKFAILFVGWIALATLVSPAGSRYIWRFRPRVQAVVAIAANVALALVPVSALAVALSTALAQIPASRSFLDRCGMLLMGLVDKPLANPGASLTLLLLALAPLGLAVGVIRAWRSQAASRKLAQTGTGPLVLAGSDQHFAFTAGLIRPRVVISRGLMNQMPSEWQPVVLAHEEAHRRGRHPLAIFLSEAVALGIPLLPFRWAADMVRASFESLADEHAARTLGNRTLVAEAIAGLALASVGATAGFEGNEVARVRRLLSDTRSTHPAIATALVMGIFGLIGFSGAHLAHCGDESVRELQVAQCQLGSSSTLSG